MFAIVQQCTETGRQNYICGNAITGMTGGCPAGMTWASRMGAEIAVREFEKRNADDVARTKRQRKYKVHPCTYTIVEIEARKSA